jgi:hypothetical protein
MIGFGFFLSGNIFESSRLRRQIQRETKSRAYLSHFFSFLVLFFPLIAVSLLKISDCLMFCTQSALVMHCAKNYKHLTRKQASKRGAHRGVHLFDVFAHNQFSSCIVLLESLLQE